MTESLIETTLIGVFIAGLLSGVHCLGMCGGIVGALSFGIDQQAQHRSRLLILVLYNIGRIMSYTIAGVLVGLLGAVLTQQFASHTLHKGLQTFSGIFLILMGLYLARWWLVLTRLETAGGVIWRRIEPFTRRYIPIRRAHHALLVGGLWGWLPCGLVYSMLTMSLTSSSALHGGLIMLAFGLGTLPNLLLMGIFAAGLQKFLRNRLVQIIAGLLVIGMGIWLLYEVWAPVSESVPQHHHH